MKIRKKVLKEIQSEIWNGNIYLATSKTVDLTLAEVEKTHVTNEFMIKKLKEQKQVDMLEVGKVIDEEKEIVKKICLGLAHPSQENQEEFSKWLQDTVNFHLTQLKTKFGIK